MIDLCYTVNMKEKKVTSQDSIIEGIEPEVFDSGPCMTPLSIRDWLLLGGCHA